MKIDEILDEMTKLGPKELDAIRAKAHELEVRAIKQWLQQRESEPWPPPRDAEPVRVSAARWTLLRE